MKLVKFLFIIVLLASASNSLFSQNKVDPTGTWSFKADAAPYEYNSGDIVIGKEGKEHTAKIVFGGSYEIKGRDVAMDKDQLTIKISIEDEAIHIKGTVTGETINGKATYSEGTISFIAERKKEE